MYHIYIVAHTQHNVNNFNRITEVELAALKRIDQYS
jgi:hypothetical protein